MKIKAADKRFGLSIKPKKDDNKKLLGFSEKEGWPEWKEENQKKGHCNPTHPYFFLKVSICNET
jgi:hypothetical protein